MQEIFKPEGYLLETNENKELTNSLQGLEYAFTNQLILEGVVTKCDNEKNLTVDLGAFTGYIRRDEVLYSPTDEPTKDIAVITRVGKAVAVKITDIFRDNGKITFSLSRKAAQRDCYENYVKRLVPGDVIDAKVTHTEPFGAFCDIGCGIISLLSVDCISVSRISHPKDRLAIGDYLRAIVKSCDEIGRITLSQKELYGTWEENAEMFCAGETAAGIVRSIEPYGIFVELAPNLAGLAEWHEDVEIGDCAAVYIKSIIPEKMKIKLVIVDTQSTPSTPKVPKYFLDTDHIDYWKYSPDACNRRIESFF